MSATGLAGAARIVRMVSGVVLLATLTRVFDTEAFGWWVLAMAAWGVFDTVRQGAAGSAYLRFASGAPDRERAEWSGALVVGSVGTSGLLVVGAGAFGWAAAPLSEVASTYLVGITTLSCVATLAGTAQVFLQSRRDFAGLCVEGTAQAVVQGLGCAFLLQVDPTHALTTALATLCASRLAGFGVATVRLFAARERVTFRNTWPRLVQLFQHGRYAAASRAGSALYRAADLWVVGTLAGPALAGLYGVSWRIAEYAELLLQPAVKVLVPEVSAEGTVPRRAAFLGSRALVALTALTALVSAPLLIAPGFLLEVLAGPAYRAAAPVLVVLVAFNLLRPADRCVGIYLDAVGHPVGNALKVATGLVTNLAGTVVVIYAVPDAPLVGVALASLVGSGVGLWVSESFARRAGIPSLLAQLPAGVSWWLRRLERAFVRSDRQTGGSTDGR